jgi:branched-chain amino acid transport system ATP-binding protein
VSAPVLETRDLTIRFGVHVAFDRVSCAFRPGELVAIVGPNGAGKTTYFNIVSGQLPASAGQVLLDGRDISGLSAAARAKAGIGRAFQITNLFPNLTVAENVRLAAQAGSPKAGGLFSRWTSHREWIDAADAILAEVALLDRRGATAAALPHGDKRKLEVALMMALHPKVYMFDEPTAGMSAEEAPVILDLIRRLKADRTKTILLVEHKMDVVRSLADRIVVLHNGQLVADGAPAEVMASAIVREAYLGVAAPARAEAADG